MKPHRPYTLEEYNPEWEETFKEISSKVKNILGDMVLAVEHIGSTSIEGMVAKPQVDLLVIVNNLDAVAGKHEEMIRAGFTHHGRGYVNEDDDYFSVNNSDETRLASIHILEEGNGRINEYLIFRDYLRTHREDRDAYIDVKKDLYFKHRDHYADYDRGKNDIILAIRKRAMEWGRQEIP